MLHTLFRGPEQQTDLHSQNIICSTAAPFTPCITLSISLSLPHSISHSLSLSLSICIALSLFLSSSFYFPPSPSLSFSLLLFLYLSLVLTLLPTQANREEGVDEAKVEKDAKVGRRLTPRWGHEIVMNTGGINRHSHWPMKCDMGPTMHCIQFLLIEPMVP